VSAPRRHLLLLGSNLPDASRIDQALELLRAIGPVQQPLPLRHGPPRSGQGAWYYNALAILDCALDDAALDAAIAAIEQRLGRRRDGAEVAIDIDRLAVAEADGAAWRPHPHAIAKGELDRAPAAGLLADSGIQIAG